VLSGRVLACAAVSICCVLVAACSSHSSAQLATAAPAEENSVSLPSRSTLVLSAAAGTASDLRADVAVIRSRLQKLTIPPTSVAVGPHSLTIRWDHNVTDLVAQVLTQVGVLQFRSVLQSSATASCSVPAPPPAPDKEAVLPELAESGQVVACFTVGPSAMTTPVIATASAELSQAPGTGVGWEVRVGFPPQPSSQFDNVARLNYQKQLAIVLDGVVESAPTVNATQFNGTVIIAGHLGAGGFSQGQAEGLAAVLQSGELVVPLTAGSITH
jgi:preprotein translocase subunit SecD